MDSRQRFARNRAVRTLSGWLRDAGVSRADSSAQDIEQFVDDLIDCAKPGRTSHEEAVEQLMTPADPATGDG